MRRPGALIHHMPRDFSEDSDIKNVFDTPRNMQHYDLGQGIRVGIGHDDTLSSEDSTDMSDFDMGQSLDDMGQEFRGFFMDKSGGIKQEQFNLRTPFRQLINGFHANEHIRLVGKHTSSRWAIDICRGQERIFHVSSRLDQKVIVRNNLKNGRWNDEERSGGQPLEKGKTFTMDLMSNGDSVQIIINGEKFADFENRGPLEEADRLEISAGLELHMLGLYDEDD